MSAVHLGRIDAEREPSGQADARAAPKTGGDEKEESTAVICTKL